MVKALNPETETAYDPSVTVQVAPVSPPTVQLLAGHTFHPLLKVADNIPPGVGIPCSSFKLNLNVW